MIIINCKKLQIKILYNYQSLLIEKQLYKDTAGVLCQEPHKIGTNVFYAFDRSILLGTYKYS